MSHLQKGCIALASTCLLGLSIWSLPARTCATDVADQAPTASQLVDEALYRELYGLEQDRQALLKRAVQLEPDYAPGRWHQGYVQFEGQWLLAEEVPQWVTRDATLKAYHQMRSQQPDTVQGHLRLANWCRNQKLAEQERAHLFRLLDLNPDHADARARLGYRQSNGEWVSITELRTADQQQRAAQIALRKWRPRLEELRDQLGDRSQKKRQLALEAIRSLQDPSVIPALESILSVQNSTAAQLVIEVVSRMPEQEATVSLASHAVTSPWQEVRSAAARALGRRPLESYVPMMLDALYTPVVSTTEVVPLSRGGLIYRHAFLREGQDERQSLVLNTRYRRVALPGGDRDESQMRAWLDSLRTAMSREQSVVQQNEATELLNTRIADALATATGQQLPPDPKKWWDWWNQENQIVQQNEKQTRTMQQNIELEVVDQTSVADADGIQVASSAANQLAECFAAGTPVWTATGYVNIEAMRVGDLVLSQNIETGELGFKPVTRTSVRPAEPLFEIQAQDDLFKTTGGHLMWVAGKGWTKVRDLRSGMQLHSLRGGLPVSEAQATEERAETYNLVVNDFHTYFVGKERVLSHDVTSRQPTNRIVPGLAGR